MTTEDFLDKEVKMKTLLGLECSTGQSGNCAEHHWLRNMNSRGEKLVQLNSVKVDNLHH